ncbi:hypothetical protein ACHAXM_006566 [Skeletonema potamos]
MSHPHPFVTFTAYDSSSIDLPNVILVEFGWIAFADTRSMSSQDEESSVASSSHDRSDDDWNGSDDGGAAKKKKRATATTSGRRQLARRPKKPRSTVGFGSYKDASDSSSSDDDGDVAADLRGNNNDDKKDEKEEEDDDDGSSGASSDSPPPQKQPKKVQRQINSTTQSNQSATKNSKSKSSSSRAAKNRKKMDSESEEAEWDEDGKQLSESSETQQSDSDSDFGAPPSSSSKRRGGAATKTKKSPLAAARQSTRTPRSRRATRPIYRETEQSSSEDEEIKYETTPSGTRRPRRSCTQQTKERMSIVVKQDMKTEREALGGVLEDDDRELLENSTSEKSDNDSSNDSSNDDGGGNNVEEDADENRLRKRLKQNKVTNGSAKRRKRTLGAESTDEDYDENNSGSDQDDSAGDYDDDDNDDDDDNFEIGSDDMAVSKRRSTRKQNRGGKKKPNYTEIDEEDIGTADEGTSDEEKGPSILTSPTTKSSGSYGSPAARKRARAGMGGRTPLDLREDGSSNEDDDKEFKPTSKNCKEASTTRKRRPYMDSSDSDNSDEQESPTPHSSGLTSHINCSSLIDDITMMNLPKNKPHVCYIAPDGKSRHCFTLDTLYRIAISAKGDGDSAKKDVLTFMQPPHFRSPMEDDLIDQIASRFGRSALVIENSAVYKKIKGGRLGSSNLDELDEFDEDGNFVGDGGEGNGVNFQDRFNRFITTLMGSSDVYCCPLCYIEADRRLGYHDDDEMIEDDESGDEQVDDSQVDRFAFVDDPLTILGHLDSDAFEVAATFCFRLLSGLKQHLKVVHGVNLSDIEGNDLFKRFQVRAGDGLLQRWLQKNLRRNTVQGDMMRYWNSGENQSFLLLLSQIDRNKPEYSSDFSLSFPNRARRVWNQVSAPYMKHGQDIDDFIADDDESEESAGGVPINPNFTPPSILKSGSDFKSPEEKLIEHLQQKNRNKSALRSDSGGESSSSSSSSSSEKDDELEILEPNPTEESDEDDWTKSKSVEAKVKRKSQSSTKNDSDDDVFDSDVKIIEDKKAKTPTSARKRVMESSSDEESY